VVFFGAIGGNFDLASFSFQVPIFGLLAKPTATATKHRARVNTIVLVFMSFLIEKQSFGPPPPPPHLVLYPKKVKSDATVYAVFAIE
jgi:hypothetical protein